MLGCLFGHNFRARYSETLPEGLTFRGKEPAEVSKQIQAAKIKVYEGDVCTSCGMVTNKPFRPLKPLKDLWSWTETKRPTKT